jgi:hypothetical protein
LGSGRIFVQPGNGPMFIYRRADGRRTQFSVAPAASGKPAQVVWAQAVADGTIAAYDFRGRQVVVFDTAGAVVRTTSLQSASGTPSPVAAFGDGRMIVLRDFLPSPYVQETGEYADTTIFMPVSSEAQPTGPSIPVTMAQRFGALDERRESDEVPQRRRGLNLIGAGVFDGQARHSIKVPLSPTTAIGAATDGIYVGRSDSAQIRFLDPTGRELNRFSIAETTLVVDSAAAARLRRAPKNDLGISFADLYRQVRIPARTPRYRQLRGDHAGRLWVEKFSLDDRDPPRWVVYSRDGTRVGAVTLPAGSRLLDASDKELLLTRTRPPGAALVQVVRYRLR